jgi:hypothetical protein
MRALSGLLMKGDPSMKNIAFAISLSALLCMAISPVHAVISFYGDWETGLVTGSGNHNWNHSQLDGQGSLTLLHDGGARQGNYYARVELRDSGCAKNTGCVERAEVVYMKNADNSIIFENENSGTVRYSFSVKFDPTWQPLVGDNNGWWGIFLQLHGPDSDPVINNPTWDFSATNTDRIRFSSQHANGTGRIDSSYDLGPLNKGKWIDFIFTVKYTKTNAGFLTIQRRYEGEANYTTVVNAQNQSTLSYSPNGNVNFYMKHGLYRNHENFTSILYMDGFTREVVDGSASAPSISAQPAAKTVSVGQTASFSVAANGTAPLNYQWRKNGSNISGATGASYTTPAAAAGDNGAVFSVVVSNSAGSVTSSGATLTVSAAASAPSITAQPAAKTVSVGQTASFSVAANGTAPLSYQWRKNGSNISGATGASYTTPAAAAGDNGAVFSVVVGNSVGSATSSGAILTVSAAATAPSITSQPASVTVSVGQTAVFSVSASGTAPLSYQWRKNGANISGATGSSYTTPATVAGDNGAVFTVVASNASGSATSSGAVLTVNSVPSGTASFYGDWESGLVTGSGNHNWKNKMAPDSGIIILSDGGARQGSKYAKITVPNSGCTSCTERAEVTDMQKADGSYLYEDENSGTVRYSFSVKFDPTWKTMTASDSNGAWGIFLQLHSPDSFATTPAFALSANDKITFALRGGDVDVNRGADYALSEDSLNLGKWIDFIITVKFARGNTGFVTIQRRDEGETNYTQVFNMQNVATVAWSSTRQNTAWWDHMYMRHGLYRNHATFTSILYLDGFTREVVNTSQTAPSITAQPAARTVAVGQTAAFSVSASGTAPLSYQWRKNGSNISGATGSSYTTPATVAGDNGAVFTVVVSNAAGSATSSGAVLTVTGGAPTAPSITAQPAARTVAVGQTAAFSVSASGTAPLSYQWRKNGSNISGATSASYTTPAAVAGDNGAVFTVVVSNAAGSATSSGAVLTIGDGSSSLVTFQGAAFASQTGSFTASFDATPQGSGIDGVIGLSRALATGYPDLAASIRFSQNNIIEARNGGAYAAVAAIPYSPNVSYHFRLVVNIPAHTYSAFVTPAGGSEVTLASDYAFRSEQSAASSLAYWDIISGVGSFSFRNFALGAAGGGGNTATAAFQGTAFPVQSDAFTAVFDATPLGSGIDGVIGLSRALATGYPDMAVGIRFSQNNIIEARNGGAYGAVAAIPYSANARYHFRVVVNVPARTYSAFVTPPGGSELTIARNYAFRSEQAAVSSLAYWDIVAGVGSFTFSGFTCAAEPIYTSAAAIQGAAFAAQTGAFTAVFDATPLGSGIDGVIGLSRAPAGGYPDMAVGIRFSQNNIIEARNGGAYGAVSAIPYSANAKYHFRVVANVPAHTYSAFVTPSGGSEVTLASNYAFRSEQASAAGLADWSIISAVGSFTFRNFSLGSGPALSPALPAAAVSQVRVYPNPFYPGRGQSQVTFDGLPQGAKVKIYTLQGELVWEGSAGAGGSALWPGKNKAGRQVASGLYLAHIKSGKDDKTIKVSVVR